MSDRPSNRPQANQNDSMGLLNKVANLARVGYWQYWPTTHDFNWSSNCVELHQFTADRSSAAQAITLEHMTRCFTLDDQKRLREAVQNSFLPSPHPTNTAFELTLTLVETKQTLKLTCSIELGTTSNENFLLGVVTQTAQPTKKKVNFPNQDTAGIGPTPAQQHLQELMFQSADDLLFIKDSRFRIVQANPAFIDLYPKEQHDKIIGYTTFEAYTEEQRREFVKEDQKALETGYSEIQETIDFPDGQRKTLLTRKIGFNDLDGARYVFGIARDITSINETKASLETANQELEEFAYRVSHDLRSPLVSAVHLLGRALKAFDKQSIDEAKKLVGVSHTSLSALEKLAMDILNLHKIRLAETQLDVIDFQHEIDTIWKRHCPNEVNIELNAHYNCTAEAITDRYGMTLVLDNLISNAIKCRRDDDNCQISINVETDTRSIKIDIWDNGIGIPLDNREKLFKIFQRFHPRHATGTGLGLYMVNQWIARVGGQLKVEHLEPGTRFLIHLPQEQRNAQE